MLRRVDADGLAEAHNSTNTGGSFHACNTRVMRCNGPIKRIIYERGATNSFELAHPPLKSWLNSTRHREHCFREITGHPKADFQRRIRGWAALKRF
jgi:hypothetical protein